MPTADHSRAKEYGHQLIYKQTFSDILGAERQSEHPVRLLVQMGVANDRDDVLMTSDEIEVSSGSEP